MVCINLAISYQNNFEEENTMMHAIFNCPLPDIRAARIDPTLPVEERLRLFAAATGDPHRFRVGETEVEVVFTAGGPSLQACLSNLCKRLQ